LYPVRTIIFYHIYITGAASNLHFQQLVRLRFGIFKRWRRTTCVHFGVRVLLQCLPIQSIKHLCAA